MADKVQKLYASPTGLQAGEEMMLAVTHTTKKVMVWFRPVVRRRDGFFNSESFMLMDGRDKHVALASMPRFNQKVFDSLVGLLDAHKDTLAQLAAVDMNVAAKAAEDLVAGRF